MPTYQYACTECGDGFEQFQSFSDDALTECPTCGGRLRKVFNSVGIVFKGSGFYRNDSREAAKTAADKGKGKDSVGAAKSDSSASGSPDKSSDTSVKGSGAKSDGASSSAGSSSGKGGTSSSSGSGRSSAGGSSSGSTTGSAA